eukprot:CAMPEP_0202978132 /NCGR_PEP_ID=MMETSP1396-20130829/84658_1 /ASSEMBLY_ACC=CAM_ASM_000872 /TAXON_ID= /ORGANISM="Pseudokeronopsis sp., Strain Brazil" /LENGTH=150 /DNA_ID=CAMNT_0049717003 /DNA_START=855 /DNA_END=1307 /DNA_ORIENTATION=-
MLVSGLELKVHFVVLGNLCCVSNVEVEAHALILVNSSQEPDIRPSKSYFRVRYELVLLFQLRHLSNRPMELHFLGANHSDLPQEAHLQLSILIQLKELLEGFFEDGVAEGVGHDVVAACLLEAALHFQHSNLVQSSHKHVNNYSCFLRSH